MRRTSATLWYSNDNSWKVEKQDNSTGEGGVVGVLKQVSRSMFEEREEPRTFRRFKDALAELARIEGPRGYVDDWLTHLRLIESKGGPKPEVDTFEMTCLACNGRKTNLDMTATLASVPVVQCPRCKGTGKETVETAK